MGEQICLVRAAAHEASRLLFVLLQPAMFPQLRALNQVSAETFAGCALDNYVIKLG